MSSVRSRQGPPSFPSRWSARSGVRVRRCRAVTARRSAGNPCATYHVAMVDHDNRADSEPDSGVPAPEEDGQAEAAPDEVESIGLRRSTFTPPPARDAAE